MRRFQREDLEELALILGNPDVMRFSPHGPYSRKQTQEFIEGCLESYRLHETGLFALISKENTRLLGYCGFLFQTVDGVKEIEIGCRLHPDFWNKGLATEAFQAIRDYGFEHKGYQRMISITDAENTASIRVAEKNGFSLEKESVFKGSRPVFIYSIERT